MARESWDRRIQRAAQLAATDGAARPLLVFYSALLGWQKEIADHLARQHGWRPAGDLALDLEVLRPAVPALLRGVAAAGPPPLAREAAGLFESPPSVLDGMLLEYWRNPSDRQFFSKAVLQPYAQRLAEDGVPPAGRQPRVGPASTSHARQPRVGPGSAANRCPFCGGAPQLSMLRLTPDPLAHGGGRSLLCATCLGSWSFRRVLCAGCGEDDERKLGYFQPSAEDHLRIEACDSCHRYLKRIDLTRLGTAVPIVDEVAGAALDAWARDRGYEKLELNLVGL